MRFCLDDGSLLVEGDTSSGSPETVRIPPPKGTSSMRTEVLPSSTTRPHPATTSSTPVSKRVKILVIVAIIFVASLIVTKLWVSVYGDSELLYQAANYNNMRLKFLLLFGADVDARDKTQGTALMGAAYRSQVDIVKTLLDNRANVNLRNNLNETALMLAAKRGNAEVVRMLLDKAPELNTKDDNGWTAVMWAAWEGNEQAARLLIKAGADLRVKNNLGETAWFLADKRGYSTLRSLLYSSSNNY
jgi:hypothetical protein